MLPVLGQKGGQIDTAPVKISGGVATAARRAPREGAGQPGGLGGAGAAQPLF